VPRRARWTCWCDISGNFDVEYKRNGVRDLMMISEPKLGLRKVLVTERHTKIEFAQTMKHVVEMYPDADVIRVVLDNLNTHKVASLYEAFLPEQARAIARKLEFHYTPKHGSCLNMAENWTDSELSRAAGSGSVSRRSRRAIFCCRYVS
jgi:hypothetical protein